MFVPNTDVVALFDYDALGRMIYSYTQRDSDVTGECDLHYYFHDGQNVIAEVDTVGSSLARCYIHGTSYVDEWAILLEGDGANNTLGTYYYLLRELYTVAGLMAKNGAFVGEFSFVARVRVRAASS